MLKPAFLLKVTLLHGVLLTFLKLYNWHQIAQSVTVYRYWVTVYNQDSNNSGTDFLNGLLSLLKNDSTKDNSFLWYSNYDESNETINMTSILYPKMSKEGLFGHNPFLRKNEKVHTSTSFLMSVIKKKIQENLTNRYKVLYFSCLDPKTSYSLKIQIVKI